MKVVKSLDSFSKGENEIVVYLAGSCGETNRWRNSVIKFLQKIEYDDVLSLDNLVIIDPYVADGPRNEDELKEKIDWESAMIDQSDIFSAYLDPSDEASISLFEIGRALMQFKNKFSNNRLNHRIIVSVHPDYKFFNDIKFELEAATKTWKTQITLAATEKNVSSHASKILEAYIKFVK